MTKANDLADPQISTTPKQVFYDAKATVISNVSSNGGLTKRERFAAQADSNGVDNWSNNAVSKFLGYPVPSFEADPEGNIVAYEQAKAKLKVIAADCLIIALNQ